jgi:DNA-binding MarR family transcriptional regulator
MEKRLIKLLGLSKNEVRVVNVLGHMPLSPAEIEKKTKLPHASVIDTLSRFIDRGLVQIVSSQHRKTYTSNIRSVFDSVHTPKESPSLEVEVYQGKEALLSLISLELVNHRHDRLLSFHGKEVSDGWLSILNPKEIQKRNALIIEHDIIVERFVPLNGYRDLFKKFPRSWQETMVGRSHITHFLPDEYFKTRTELMMFSDIVMLYETHNQKIVVFRNKDTVSMYASMFDMMRTIGRKINSEEEFQKYLLE